MILLDFFNYFLDEETFEYLLRAVELIAEYGSRMLPAYRYEADSGTWNHRSGDRVLPVSLDDFELGAQYAAPPIVECKLSDYLAEAEKVFTDVPAEASTAIDGMGFALEQEQEALRWFYLPGDAA